MSAYVFLQTVEEIGAWSLLTRRGCVSAYPTLPMTPHYPNMRRPVVHVDPFKVRPANPNGSRSCLYCNQTFRKSAKQILRIIAHQKKHRCEYLHCRLNVVPKATWKQNFHLAWKELEFLFQQRWALSEDIPKDMWDITMPTIEWEELPPRQCGWHDLDRVGNVNWFYDQFSGEWCEVEMEILESERFYHSIEWLHYC
ncbi:hypothetical protein K440DRAFT_638876 [Wilcoxina mikolae CBS 423.85]|nr:hypothetical protein K440DRAFT_638876 [Wilcoxina mikolae CBS 423.85]